MRLWSLHPKYLDPQGLVALWREALLAQAVLAGKTRGYTQHPQLERFKSTRSPAKAIADYLHGVCDEADRRGYHFDRSKIGNKESQVKNRIAITRGQLNFEWKHLEKKLRSRHPDRYRAQHHLTRPLPHPFFRQVPGDIATWERG